MTETEKLIYKDYVQRTTLKLVKNATVQGDVTKDGVLVRVEFDGLGHEDMLIFWGKIVRWGKIDNPLLVPTIQRELLFALFRLAKERYYNPKGYNHL